MYFHLSMIAALLLSACITRDPPKPAPGLYPQSSQYEKGALDSPKVDMNNPSFQEDEWAYGEETDTSLQDQATAATFPVVYFAYDQDTLSAQTEQALQQVAKRLREESGYTLQIQGHCDERGTTEYNLALGDRRANRVKSYLEGLGVPSSRLATISYGEERPAAEGHDEEAYALNRRVEFQIPALTH